MRYIARFSGWIEIDHEALTDGGVWPLHEGIEWFNRKYKPDFSDWLRRQDAGYRDIGIEFDGWNGDLVPEDEA